MSGCGARRAPRIVLCNGLVLTVCESVTWRVVGSRKGKSRNPDSCKMNHLPPCSALRGRSRNGVLGSNRPGSRRMVNKPKNWRPLVIGEISPFHSLTRTRPGCWPSFLESYSSPTKAKFRPRWEQSNRRRLVVVQSGKLRRSLLGPGPYDLHLAT